MISLVSTEGPSTCCSNLLFTRNSQSGEGWLKRGGAKTVYFRQWINLDSCTKVLLKIIVLNYESYKATIVVT